MQASASNVPRYLILDPGKRTGWSLFSADGTILKRGVYLTDITYEMLTTGWATVRVCVAENFRVFPHMAYRLMLSTLPAVEMLGSIKLAAEQRGWQLHLQEPQIMRTAIAWIGYSYSPKSHVPDQISAHGHGVYFLVETLGILTVEKARADKEEYEARAKGST